MPDCPTNRLDILTLGNTPDEIANTLLKQIEDNKDCEGHNKYEIALTNLRNAQQKMINIGADANSRRKLQFATETVISQQKDEQQKKQNVDFARQYQNEQSSIRSSMVSDDSSTRPLTGKSTMSEEERQSKLNEDRQRRLREYDEMQKAQKAKPKRRTFSEMLGFTSKKPDSAPVSNRWGGRGKNKTKKSKKGFNLCLKKTAKKCTRVRGCKIASGTKRTYCRKKRNHTKKSNKV
mgnify:CR=1 FL=1